jgi:endonuclease/exonuclease/phosphatase family metal-dependent hydrolase
MNKAVPTSDSLVQNQRQLRLLSFNIQAGASTNHYREYLTRSWQHLLPHPLKQRNLLAVANLVSNYDIVALQEADGGSLRSSFYNQVQFIAEHAQFPYWTHQANRKLVKLAESSNGALSRIAPTQVIAHALPGAIPGRGALELCFGPKRRGLRVWVVHLALTKRARRLQIQYLIDGIGDLPHVILMGDLNTGGDSAELHPLFKHTQLQPPPFILKTYPSWKPQRAIDHILVSRLLTPLSLEVPLITVSDHLPIALNVALPRSCRIKI